jgi:HSP20 family molecular chaperone IbpA
MKVYNKLIVVFILSLSIGFCFSQEHGKIVEKVEVVNVVVPVRVFYKGLPVKGLTEENFKISSNDKDIPVTSFEEKRQKIAERDRRGTKPEPRLFVLIFNINDYNMNLIQHVDTIFEKIIRPTDRLMIVSNSFFLTDRPVRNKKQEKAKIKQLLRIETTRTKQEMKRVEYEMKTLAQEFIWQVADGDLGIHPQTLMRDFNIKYKDALNNYKKRYANIIKTQSIRMANYLKDKDMKKWVINFHQVGIFPQMKSGRDESNGGLRGKLEELSRRYHWLRMDLFELDTIFAVAEGNMVKEYSKYFLNSEVTFHTILMKGFSNVYLEYCDYKPIATEAEIMMRRLTRMTGGEEMGSNNVRKFLDKICEKEDVYYVLTYNPGDKKSKIIVTVTDGSGKNYDVVYDNQHRPWYMKRAIKKIQQEEAVRIAIKNLSYNRGILSVRISGIKMGQLEGETGKKGKIHLLIKILDSESKEVNKVEKAFKCKEKNFVMRMKPPALKKGEYDIVVQVTDLLTGKNDVEIEPVKI